MRYMLLVYSREQAPAYPESMQQIAEGHRRVMAEATAKGILEGAEPLRPATTATTKPKSSSPATTYSTARTWTKLSNGPRRSRLDAEEPKDASRFVRCWSSLRT